MNQEYSDYLLSEAWKAKRTAKFQHSGRKCEICGVKKKLQIHHLTYERIFKEEMEDLMVLCKRHHELVEDLYKKGKLSKLGTASQLRVLTLKCVMSNALEEEAIAAPLKALIGDASEPRKKRIFRLLQNPEFCGILKRPRKEAKKGIKSMSHRCGNIQCSAYTHMLMTYDAFHGLNGYTTLRKEVLEATVRLGLDIATQNPRGVAEIKEKISTEKEFNSRVKSLCSKIHGNTVNRRIKLAVETAEVLLQELQSFHRRIQIECGMTPTVYTCELVPKIQH